MAPLMSKLYSLVLARTVLKAANIREESWDQASFDEDTKTIQGIKRVGRIPNLDSSYYKKTIDQAALEACKAMDASDQLATPIAILLRAAWNDSLEWAMKVVEGGENG